jgi:hypothetical protein
MQFAQPPGGDGNDPNKPNEFPTTPTSNRGKGRPRKAPDAPNQPNSKRNRFALGQKNDADLQSIIEDMGDLNPGGTSDIISAFESTTPRENRGLFRESKSASPISGYGFGVGIGERQPMPRVTSDPSIGDLEDRTQRLSIVDVSKYNTPVSSPSSSRSGSPPGAPRKFPNSKGGMSRKSKKSRRSKKSRKTKKSKKTKKTKKSKKNRKSRKHK